MLHMEIEQMKQERVLGLRRIVEVLMIFENVGCNCPVLFQVASTHRKWGLPTALSNLRFLNIT